MPPTTLNSEEPVEVKVPDDERTSTPYRQGPRAVSHPPAAALCRLIVVIGVICSSTWRVSICLLLLGGSVVRCSTESPVIAVLGARVVG